MFNELPQRGELAPAAGAPYLGAMDSFLSALIPVAVGVVFVVLVIGIWTMFRGGDVSRSWSNRMMRLRVLAQFIAILILCGALYYKTQMGGG
jgi:heme/copper-type cytochrome/quinol oxidase subunit 2